VGRAGRVLAEGLKEKVSWADKKVTVTFSGCHFFFSGRN
jgi:hypothetical protein